MAKPTIILMCGISYSGKSTVAETLSKEYSAEILSTDKLIEIAANAVQKTYSDVFEECISEATRNYNEQIDFAFKNKQDIILDRTHLTVKSRARVLSRVPKDYIKEIVVVRCTNVADYVKRIKLRDKFIPEKHRLTQFRNYVRPELEEGFDKIIEIKNDNKD